MNFNLSLYKYAFFLLVLILLPFRTSNIIFPGMGWYSSFPVSLLLYSVSFFVVLYWVAITIPNKKFAKYELAICSIKAFYVTWILFYIVTYFKFGYQGSEYAMKYIGFLLSFVSHIVLGWIIYLYSKNSNVTDASIIWIISVVPVLMIGSISDVSINYRLLFGESGYDYLLVGDIIVFVTFLFLLNLGYSKKTAIVFFVIVLITSFVLFKNGSRTSFYAFVFSLSLSFLFIYRLKFAKALFLFAIAFSLGSYIFDIDYSDVLNSRIFMILDSGSSGSLGVREQLHNIGLKRIGDNFIFGDFLGQINSPLAVSAFGSYMHNILSHFSQFGVIGFVLYSASWIYLIVITYTNKERLTPDEKFIIFGLLQYSISCLAFSRAFVHTIFEAYWCFIVLCIIGVTKERKDNHG
ncbi:hypothetical protein V9654_000200 [Vibrio parahaemolyticus]|nr:hypothetical protein [Vibrio parahaemolyticus]